MFMLQSNYNIEIHDELNHNSNLMEGNTDDISDDISHHESTNENDSEQNINVDDEHDENVLSKKKSGLRKGKWTAEEERYTNKVIESFNFGTLKLSENERGITLRAYLADKLGCDPMRITKKYTGASCLGKRVYHAHKQVAPTEQIEKVTLELNILEQNFRQKLQQINRTRNGTSNITETNNNTISTPAIDALFNNNINYPPSAWNQVLSSKIHNINNYLYPIPMSSGYPSNCMIPQYRSSSNEQFMQIFPPNYHYYLKAAAENGFLQYEKCERTSSIGCEGSSLSSGQSGNTTKASENNYHIPHTNNTSAMNQQFYNYQNHKDRNYCPSHPSLGMKSTIESNYIPIGGQFPTPKFPREVSPPLTAMVMQSHANVDMNCSIEQLTEEESSNDGFSNEEQEKKHAAIPICNENSPEIISYNSNNRDNIDLNHEHSTNKYYSNKLPQSQNKKVKVSERDSEAANSLLGFFTHLERNNSQEDLVEFFEDVQKTAVASTTPKGGGGATYASTSADN